MSKLFLFLLSCAKVLDQNLWRPDICTQPNPQSQCVKKKRKTLQELRMLSSIQCHSSLSVNPWLLLKYQQFNTSPRDILPNWYLGFPDRSVLRKNENGKQGRERSEIQILKCFPLHFHQKPSKVATEYKCRGKRQIIKETLCIFFCPGTLLNSYVNRNIHFFNE